MKELIPELILKGNVMESNGIFYRIINYIQIYQTNNLLDAILTTSYARFELWKILEFCRKKGINVYYCDTDSIVVENNRVSEFSDYLNDKQIGKLKAEFTALNFQAYNCKEYECYDNKTPIVKIKGFTLPKEKLYGSIPEIYKNGCYNQRVESITTCLNRKLDFNSISIYHKHKLQYYNKRNILPDKSNIPIKLNEKIEKNNELIIRQIIGL